MYELSYFGDSYEDMFQEIDTKIGKLLTDLLYWKWLFTVGEYNAHCDSDLEALKAQRDKAKHEVEEMLYQAHKLLSNARAL
ncbi:hypothetical protein [Amycolatopsis azurea]|uniref:Uncharacterized protein n=1 Tax=Amycolatopsis azurea DSM 43854 TaxID=1238180 RepID=M2Q5Z4_9PSEU|nr:hypothetical protein [Amycolatopsis azurea]EMD27390.1 hypothetical protein C791_2402 [Amycolatopsis azurea DSM 43854]OOC03791.1 hypothetical protein B0293_26385 [Amycolatopsis azurea DSM 43854]